MMSLLSNADKTYYTTEIMNFQISELEIRKSTIYSNCGKDKVYKCNYLN